MGHQELQLLLVQHALLLGMMGQVLRLTVLQQSHQYVPLVVLWVAE